MLAKLKQRIIHWGDAYPPRWGWPVTNIYGGPEGAAARTIYMTRIYLSPKTRWGQLYLHIFMREDMDRDPHDHPFNFWTIPLNQGYYEDVYEHDGGTVDQLAGASGCFRKVFVRRWHVSFRRAQHTHRIVATQSGKWPLITLVWRGGHQRDWGFWCHAPETRRGPERFFRFFIPWKSYVFHGEWANHEGNDALCPGAPKDGTY